MTTITILGAGNMARGIATRALTGRNEVQILDRDPGKATDLASELDPGAGTVSAGDAGDAVVGEIVVLAVPYEAAAPLVMQYGPALTGKVIVDITNPVDFTTFEPVTPPGRSAAEEIATKAPAGAPVVKAFNTTFAGTLVAGQVNGEPLDVLIAGDDEKAKSAVASFVESSGLRPLDTGPLSRARQLEALGLLHMAVQFTRGTKFTTAIKILP